jgi:hypothetical protein
MTKKLTLRLQYFFQDVRFYWLRFLCRKRPAALMALNLGRAYQLSERAIVKALTPMLETVARLGKDLDL